MDSNGQSKKHPDEAAERLPKEGAGRDSVRAVRHDKPVEFPVSDSAVSQADGVP